MLARSPDAGRRPPHNAEDTMSDLSWSLLNLAAWAFGLKAAYDLRAEFPPLTRTWAFLTWAVWACLLMEVAMIGARAVPGLGLFSAVTGIVSAC
ncbi:MAG: hypothetical protein AB7N90_14165 [Vicinamibacterales bacterium]